MIAVKFFETPAGILKAKASEKGILSLDFCSEMGVNIDENQHFDPLIAELDEYFHHKRKTFSVSLDLQGTDFQLSVWNELLKIPFGKTRSYSEQAMAMKQPLAIRAIASANGKNPIAIIVPCHRVIGSDGSLTGYAGGLEKKKWLLQHEGVLSFAELF